MDLQMPEMNGYEATKKIRNSKDKKIREIPVIALTASVMYNVQKKVSEAMIDDYVLKPFNPDNLYNKILMQVGE